MAGIVEKIFITGQGGADMRPVDQVEAVANQGLAGDRYKERTGYWTNVDECQVTLIDAQDLEEIERTTGVKVADGQHRRNIVTRGVDLDSLAGRAFQVGEAVLGFDRPRPPCGYIAGLTEPGMTKALMGRGGICAWVVRGGMVKPGDSVEILDEQQVAALTRG